MPNKASTSLKTTHHGEQLKGDELEQEIDPRRTHKDNKTLQQTIRRAGAMTGQKVAAPIRAKVLNKHNKVKDQLVRH